MYKMIQAIPLTYAALFPVLNPLGSALIFFNAHAIYSEETRHHISAPRRVLIQQCY